MQATRASERVLAGLARRRAACVQTVVDEAAALQGYAGLHPSELADLAENVGEGFDAIVRAIAGQCPLDEDDIAFLWAHIYRRTTAGVPQGEMLAVVRIFQRVLWDAIVELADHDQDDREAALTLARPLLAHIDVLSNAVDKAFLEAGEAVASRATHARRQLMELLLSGAPPAPGATLNMARTLGLENGTNLAVIVARPAAFALDATGLRVAAGVVARSAGRALEPLAVARGDELVVVLPSREQDIDDVVGGLRSAHRRLLERGILLALGMSTVHDGLDAVPVAYAEACLALEQVRESGGVLALGGLDVHDYLILRAGDRTAWRLVPSAVRDFVEDDAAHARVLGETLLAYAACDLSVKLAAARLYVHPNTVHYRLAKIEAQTGLDARRLRDVQLLTTAIQLHRVNR